MISRRSWVLVVALLASAGKVPPAQASYHFMQIEQVIGGVNGDVNAQAIQLRMRTSGQKLVNHGLIEAWDAAGENPVLIIDLTTAVANGDAGDRVLITSPAFQGVVSPVQTPDFTMTHLIPASYLAAGSLTWEEDTGAILWRLSWGGASFTGSGTLDVTNDADGDANPPFAGGLPYTGLKALKFDFGEAAPSTNNAADYSVTAGASTWTNNARLSETLVGAAGVGGSGALGEIELGSPSPNPGPGAGGFTFSIAMPRAARVRVSVYEASGRQVRTLIDRELEAGQRRFGWDGRDARGMQVASGAYYLRLASGAVKRSRKLMVVR